MKEIKSGAGVKAMTDSGGGGTTDSLGSEIVKAVVGGIIRGLAEQGCSCK